MSRKKVAKKKMPPKTQRFDWGETIILGLTGSLGSGCSFIAEGIKENLGINAFHYKLSDFLREKLEQRGINKPTTTQLQDEGNKLRRERGLSVLAKLCLDKIIKEGKEKPYSKDTVIIIDGIRNDGEVRSFRAFPNFYLISVHSEEQTRKARLVGKSAPDTRFEKAREFEEADKRDQEEDIEYGQQVKRCNYLADIIINNEDKLTSGTAKKAEFFSKIAQNYIDTMKAVREGSQVPDRPPSINETLMTMAYCISKRSSCEKRKVGAVIAHVTEYKKITEIKRPEDNIKFQIISSGYNEVPLGTDPCKLSKYEMCYRDYKKKEHANKISHCPNCGTRMPKKILSDMKLLSGYICSSCKINISNTYLPGGGQYTGKLLDICRALHGEEMAIIGLAGISKPDEGELVLYTTTFPCNLCANKIVAAGIKRVWYAEPYTMEESKNILEKGDVYMLKFEGVKSTAYFRLYS